jgi:hypothetical protein
MGFFSFQAFLVISAGLSFCYIQCCSLDSNS